MSITDLEKRIKATRDEETRGFHIFSNINRRLIFRELTRLPCRTASSIGMQLDLEPKVVEWHLKKLSKEGYVDIWDSKRRYYYVPLLVDIADLPFFSTLNSREARIIVHYLLEGCRPVSEIDVSRSTFYRYVKLYREWGIAELHGASSSYLCPGKKFKVIVDKYEKKGTDFKREMIKKIESEGFYVMVEGAVNNELKIEVRGMERFTMGVFISPLKTSLEV